MPNKVSGVELAGHGHVTDLATSLKTANESIKQFEGSLILTKINQCLAFLLIWGIIKKRRPFYVRSDAPNYPLLTLPMTTLVTL